MEHSWQELPSFWESNNRVHNAYLFELTAERDKGSLTHIKISDLNSESKFDIFPSIHTCLLFTEFAVPEFMIPVLSYVFDS